jgi:hypothetical protein
MLDEAVTQPGRRGKTMVHAIMDTLELPLIDQYPPALVQDMQTLFAATEKGPVCFGRHVVFSY